MKLWVWTDGVQRVRRVVDWITMLPTGTWTVGRVLKVSHTIVLRTSPADLAMKEEMGHSLRFSEVDLERLGPASKEMLETAVVAGMVERQVGEDLWVPVGSKPWYMVGWSRPQSLDESEEAEATGEVFWT